MAYHVALHKTTQLDEAIFNGSPHCVLQGFVAAGTCAGGAGAGDSDAVAGAGAGMKLAEIFAA